MNRIARTALLLLTALLGVSSAEAGNRHRHGHSHFSFGFHVGPPAYVPYYAAPIYVPPRVIVVPQAPVYVDPPMHNSGRYWQYCQWSEAYYPQVTDCPGGWIRVPAR